MLHGKKKIYKSVRASNSLDFKWVLNFVKKVISPEILGVFYLSPILLISFL